MLDPTWWFSPRLFIGSGTTAVAAQKLKRCWVGCDINKGAIQTTSRRLQEIVKKRYLLDREKEMQKLVRKLVRSNEISKYSHLHSARVNYLHNFEIRHVSSLECINLIEPFQI